MNEDMWMAAVRDFYDELTAGDPNFFGRTLMGDALLRNVLADFAAEVVNSGGGPVVDFGCGVGHVTKQLYALGLNVRGIDFSSAMIGIAQRENPDLKFQAEELRCLSFADQSVGGLFSLWSMAHLPEGSLRVVLAELHRVLRSGSPVFLAMHSADGTRPATSEGGASSAYRHGHGLEPNQMVDLLREVGFQVESRLYLKVEEAEPGVLLYARRA